MAAENTAGSGPPAQGDAGNCEAAGDSTKVLHRTDAIVGTLPVAARDDEIAGETTAVAASRAVLHRVFARLIDFWAPRAKRALSACLVIPAVQQHQLQSRLAARADDATAAAIDANHDRGRQLRVSVEAAGSGVVILPALSVDPHATVGGLKRLVVQSWGTSTVVPPPTPPVTIRLFVGHGGEELLGDAVLLRAYAVEDGATLALVRVADAERDALVALFHATSGHGWRLSENWASSSAPLSAWQGVSCHPDSGGDRGVRALNLSYNSLRGACEPAPAPSSTSQRNVPSRGGAASFVGIDGWVDVCAWTLDRQRRRRRRAFVRSFAGHIPTVVEQLARLRKLLLSHNNLEGARRRSSSSYFTKLGVRAVRARARACVRVCD